MNERIKELWNKAKVNLDEDFSSGRKSISIPKSYDEMMQEKFAELIVRECAEVADNADAMRQKWEGIGKYVRKHFGVE